MIRVSLDVDVAVVGAGFSGLAAARTVRDAGASVAVLEARDRVGGRCQNAPLPGAPEGWTLDLGAAWTGRGQDRIQALAAEFAVELVERWSGGDDLTVFRGQPVTDDDSGWLALMEGVGRLDELASTVPRDAPWAASEAEAWDTTPFGAWLDEHLADPLARAIVDLSFESFFCFPPAQMSLLHSLHYASIKGGVAEIVGGKDTHLFHGGTAGLAERLAALLGDAIHLGQPAARITQHDLGVAVTTPALTVEASRVIIAVPPVLAERIDFDPALPSWRTMIHHRAPMGTGYKLSLVYPDAFWRAAGLSGRIIEPDGAVVVTIDVSPPGGRPGVLTAFAGIAASLDLERLETAARRQIVLNSLTRHLGTEAGRPEAYVETLWGIDPWSRGDLATFAPGFWTTVGRWLREPVGRVHWAGTETAAAFPNEMDGAIRAGERAAVEVLDRLG